MLIGKCKAREIKVNCSSRNMHTRQNIVRELNRCCTHVLREREKSSSACTSGHTRARAAAAPAPAHGDLRSAWHALGGRVSARCGPRPRHNVNGSQVVSCLRQQREELEKFDERRKDRSHTMDGDQAYRATRWQLRQGPQVLAEMGHCGCRWRRLSAAAGSDRRRRAREGAARAGGNGTPAA